MVQQSRDRGHHRVRDIKSYFPLRRDTIGTLPSFSLIELHFNIPDHVINHPTIQRMTDLCTDMVSIGNDLYSYNAEYVSPFQDNKVKANKGTGNPATTKTIISSQLS